MGEVANQETLDRIVAILKNHKSVNRYRIPKSMHLGPESILVVVELDLADDLDFSSAKGLLKKIRQEIKQQCPKVTHVFFQVLDA